MKKLKIKTVLKSDGETHSYYGDVLYDERKNILKYTDEFAHLTLDLDNDILVRETTDAILSYKFKKEIESHFEVYVKELKKAGSINLVTKELQKGENYFSVIYRLEGNDFDHEYTVKWSE